MKFIKYFVRKSYQNKGKDKGETENFESREVKLRDGEWAMDLHSMRPKSYWDFRCESLSQSSSH